ncbi:MAG: hypothetical protein ACPG47_04695 [Leucothrix sp.]
MIKTFTLNKIEHHINSARKGMLTYHITDETGYSRTVSGMSILDENQQIKSINPIHKRELPLIDTLSHLKENEKFSLDFSSFNKYFNRDTNKTVNQEAYDNVMMMSDEPPEDNALSRIMIIGSGLALTLFGLIMLIMNLG